MKISRNRDGSKATEISVDETENTLMQLHGDTAIKAVHGTSGQVSDVANITQSGEFDFVARPSVGGGGRCRVLCSMLLAGRSDEFPMTTTRPR